MISEASVALISEAHQGKNEEKALMVRYRRSTIEGGVYFFTLTLKDRRSDILRVHISDFKRCYNKVKTQYPFKNLAYVVLPDHLHCIWQLPSGDANYSLRWREIKKGFTRVLLKKGIPLKRNKHGEYNLWQRRYWEHTIRDEKDLENHVNYIHYNPVKHGLVQQVKDWSHSSFPHYVKRGMLKENWAVSEVLLLNCEYGE